VFIVIQKPNSNKVVFFSYLILSYLTVMTIMSTNRKAKKAWGIPSLKINFTGRMTR